MFDPSDYRSVTKWTLQDLENLPEEDDRHEYKSGRTFDKELGEKIERAASGFWNSGGGLFVAGIDQDRRPDGLPPKVGRQPRRDWIDMALARVAPRAEFAVHCIEGLPEGRIVAMIGFAPSEVGPHMASDHRYYLRAGAHTGSAGQVLVEALFARRHHRRPRLVHVLSRSPETATDESLMVEIVPVTDAPALDVEVSLSGVPESWKQTLFFPVKTTLIDAGHPFSFRFRVPTLGFSGNLSVVYHDLAGRRYEYRQDVNSKDCLRSWDRGPNHLEEIHLALKDGRSRGL